MENLLNREVTKESGSSDGATVAGMVVGLVIGIVLVVAVAIPVTTGVIESANLTGTTATVVGVIPILLAMVPAVMVAQLF
jgi:hypothetical protein